MTSCAEGGDTTQDFEDDVMEVRLPLTSMPNLSTERSGPLSVILYVLDPSKLITNMKALRRYGGMVFIVPSDCITTDAYFKCCCVSATAPVKTRGWFRESLKYNRGKGNRIYGGEGFVVIAS